MPCARGCPFFTRRPDIVHTCLIEAESGGTPSVQAFPFTSSTRREPQKAGEFRSYDTTSLLPFVLSLGREHP